MSWARRLLEFVQVLALCVGIGLGRWWADGGPWHGALVDAVAMAPPVAFTYWLAFRRGRDHAREVERKKLLAAVQAHLATSQAAAAGIERSIASNDEILRRLYALRDLQRH